jgi:hypothetical protein
VARNVFKRRWVHGFKHWDNPEREEIYPGKVITPDLH